MQRILTIIFLILVMLTSCNKEDEEPRAVNFTVFFESICEQTFSRLCVSEVEYKCIRKIFEDNQNGPDLDCLPIMVTDLEGTLHEGFLRGFSATRAEIPCFQEEDITF